MDEGDDGGGGGGGSVGVGGSGGGFTGWSVGLVGRAIGRSVQVAAVTTTTKTTTTTATAADECARVRAYDGMRGKLSLRGATAAWHRRLRDERESCALSTHSRDYILLLLSYPRTAHARSTCISHDVRACVRSLSTYLPPKTRTHALRAPHHSTLL